MSPDERIAKLAQEARAELARLDRVAGELAEPAASLEPGCSRVIRQAVAADLHSFYTGCEHILARIARAFGRMPAGEG